MKFFDDDDLESITSKIDSISNALPQIQASSIDLDSSAVIDSFIKNTFEDSEFAHFFDNITIPRDRLDRYTVYDEMYRSVPIIKRIMRVYFANILQKNPVTGKCLLITKKSKLADSEEGRAKQNQAYNFAEKVVAQFDILKKLKMKILPILLQYGDCFVEVVNVKESSQNINLDRTSIPLLESNLNIIENKMRNLITSTKVTSSDVNSVVSLLAEYMVAYDDSAVVEAEEEANEDFSSTVVLKIHRPHNIVILESKYGSILGYLEVSKEATPQYQNVTQSFSSLMGRLMSTNISSPYTSTEYIVNRLLYYILEKVKKEVKAKYGSQQFAKIDDLLGKLNPEVYMFLKKIFIEQGLDQKSSSSSESYRSKVRFIPVHRMVHFDTPTSFEYSPYSASFIDPLIFPSKLFIISQLSNIITKLSRAAPIRKWSIDVGNTQMHAGQIQKFKRELYNTRITLEDLASFKSIPKILSDFKDMFVLSKGGMKPVDVDIVSHGDPNIRIADLEDARREIISLSGVPAAYLGYADTIELKEQLVHTNIAFASEISDIQENISVGLTKILDIVASIKELEIKPSDYVQISLIPPIVLMLQLIEATLSSVGNITNVFANLQVPFDPYYFLQQYIPYIDWDEFRTRSQSYVTYLKTKSDIEKDVVS